MGREPKNTQRAIVIFNTYFSYFNFSGNFFEEGIKMQNESTTTNFFFFFTFSRPLNPPPPSQIVLIEKF